jgi:hypothetical protein
VDDQESVFEVPEPPADLAARAKERGWPDDLLPRMMALRFPLWKIGEGLNSEFPTVDMMVSQVADRERLANGLVVRLATWEDDERLIELFANSLERLGEWDVTVERGPNPFAQQRMQENAQVKMVVDRGVALAVSVQTGCSSYVNGEQLSIGWMGGWRVRNGFRRHGFSNLLLSSPGSAANVFGLLTYWYVRMENTTANNWIAKTVETFDSPRSFEKLTATVYHLDASTGGTPDSRVRPVKPDDLARCVELINATHAGLDLFRPYTVPFLEARMHDLFWGPKPHFVPEVYGWNDMHVLEENGEIVACGGVWDRGRDSRERWKHRETGEERIVDTACLMDFGFASGHEKAAAALTDNHLAIANSLGRTSLSAALEHHPNVVALLAHTAPRPETRTLETMGFATDELKITATVTRPYTDLGYW